MVIALIICIPITTLVVGFFVLKSVQLGLRWQIQTTNKQEPELKNPIVEAVQAKKADELMEYSKQQMKEYFFGGDA